MIELVIEKGIPITRKRMGTFTSGMQSMEIGDSFLTSKALGNFAVPAKRIGIKITARKQPDGQLRIWRIS